MTNTPLPSGGSPLARLIAFCLENRLLVLIFVVLMAGWGMMVAPFDWDLGGLPRDPVPVDAIPDIGENQQIVFTEWMGRSPQDVEDQIGYPLTVSLLGIPGVRTVRSFSMFGISSIYVIFEEDVEFYWSRSRVLEKLSSLSPGTLPDGVQPRLGPDATALGQVFWYTLAGLDETGEPTGGWDLDELRSAQDWQVRYALMGVDGVAEVASVGGYVREYQIDVDPDAMRAYGVSLGEVFKAVKMSNLDVGARSIEVNKVEYLVRGVGFLKSVADIELTVIKATDGVPVYVKNVATVSEGPALRRGALDREGAEAVGGVVVARYGENPLAAIKAVKAKIEEIAPGLPRKTLPDGRVSQLTIVPFYDRSGLIHETLETLNTALVDEVLVTIIVVLVMVMHFRSSLLIAGLLPLAVLMSFIAMRRFGVDANVVALSGIAIAIGTMVDMGVVVSENILKRLSALPKGESPRLAVYEASREVGGAVLTAVATTVVSFLPVFTMVAAEGKLFKPLAFTKTFALIASVVVAVVVIPPTAELLLAARRRSSLGKRLSRFRLRGRWAHLGNWVTVLLVGLLLARHWLPLGPERGLLPNFLFTALLLGSILGAFHLLQRYYTRMLAWCLDHKAAFLAFPVVLIFLGLNSWLGFDTFFGWLPRALRTSAPVSKVAHVFPGMGKEFMPSLDEGSFLLMPTTMPHASIGEALDVLQRQDLALTALPEIASAVGKIGRVESPLDPAPVSMIETVISYHSEYLLDENGKRQRFRWDGGENDLFRNEAGTPVLAADGEPYSVRGRFERDAAGALIPDRHGKPFRLWRPALDPDLNEGRDAWPGVRNADEIWDAIVKAAEVPGTTSAPKLQPIAARIVMLQSGMRAPMGLKIAGPDLATLETVALEFERLLKEVPAVNPATVFADRIVGKPYLEIEIDREAIARHGIHLATVQEVIEVAVGGKRITSTVEGRERYPVRVRYQRELRDSIEALDRILVPAPGGSQIPLEQLAEIHYVRGPQMIKSEDTFLTGYVLFDGAAGLAEVEVVEQARDYLTAKIDSGELQLPAGVSYRFAGSYENQVRAEKKLQVVLPLALMVIFTILYLQFRSAATTALVFSGIAVAWAGGFMMLWLYGQSWFLQLPVVGDGLRQLFQVGTVNLSVAVWVGFLALFGIASDDGVIMATYLDQVFAKRKPESRAEIRAAVLEGAQRRIRPALMTAGTTILALLPVLTSTGRGADIMVPMAIPSFGGMCAVLLTVFTVPVLYAWVREIRLAGAQGEV